MDDKRGRGRPELSQQEKNEMLQKIEPYLKCGLSVRKALLEVKIPNSTFYRLMEEDGYFREQIGRFRQFTAVLINNALVRELQFIIEKQNGSEIRKIRPQPLNKDDRAFLQWFALNCNQAKEEFGRRERIDMFDPEAEIQKVKRIIEESTTKEIVHA